MHEKSSFEILALKIWSNQILDNKNENLNFKFKFKDKILLNGKPYNI